MSAGGQPHGCTCEGANELRAAVVAACWHREIADGLLAGALRGLDACGVVRADRRTGAGQLRAARSWPSG